MLLLSDGSHPNPPTWVQMELFAIWAYLWDNGFIAGEDEYDGNPFAL